MIPRLHAVRAFAAAAALGLGAPPLARAQCLTSAASWRNTSFPSQAAPFGAAFDATPGGAKIDAVTGLSLGGAADARVPYTAGSMYRFRLAVDPVAHRYSVYVAPSGAAERLLALNYAFRSEQALAASLNSWALQAGAGSHQVCRFALTATARACATTGASTSRRRPRTRARSRSSTRRCGRRSPTGPGSATSTSSTTCPAGR